MGVTISHNSALEETRILRAEGVDVRMGIDCVALRRPSPWEGTRWGAREFLSEEWHHRAPSKRRPLDVLVPDSASRIRMDTVNSHICGADLPSSAILWLDATSSMVSPAMLFVQMAETLSFPALVMLGHELCGRFSRSATDPGHGPVVTGLKPAVTIDELRAFLRRTESLGLASGFNAHGIRIASVRGLGTARRALKYVADGAASVPEAVLATMYALPPDEGGFGMGPISLNARCNVARPLRSGNRASRYPDIMFSFAPVGINYEGKDHLDLDALIEAALAVGRAQAEGLDDTEPRVRLKAAREAIEGKFQDDIWRDRELMATGQTVVRAAKEDLYAAGGLDRMTRQILAIASAGAGVDTSAYERVLDDPDFASLRHKVLRTLLHGEESRVA